MSDAVRRAAALAAHPRAELGEAEARRALAEEPESSEAHALLALALSRQGKHQDAIIAAESALRLAPTSANAHRTLAGVLHDAELPKDAEPHAREAVRLEPGSPSAHRLLALVAHMRGHREEALREIDLALSLAPTNATLHVTRGRLLHAAGRAREAESSALRALAIEPNDAEVHELLGLVRLALGDAHGAALAWREVLRLDPARPGARDALLDALRARSGPYRWMTRYRTWANGLSPKVGLVISIALILGLRAIGTLAKARGWDDAFATTLGVGFAGLLWTRVAIAPLTTLTLRLDPVGRVALTREEILASDQVAALTIAGIVFGLVGAIAGEDRLFLAAFVSLVLVLPVGLLPRRAPAHRRGPAIGAAACVVLAYASATLVFVSEPASVMLLIVWTLLVTFVSIWIIRPPGGTGRVRRSRAQRKRTWPRDEAPSASEHR